VPGENGPAEGLLLAEKVRSRGIADAAGPRLEWWALRADLTNENIQIRIGPLPGESSAFKTRRQAAETDDRAVLAVKVSRFAGEYGCAAAINANPFEILRGKSQMFIREGDPQIPVGLVVSEGVLAAPPNPRYDALVFYAAENGAVLPGEPSPGSMALAGRAAIVSQDFAGTGGPDGPGFSTGNRRIENAAGGFYKILEDGEPTAQALSQRGAARHPRSAAGISADGRYLYLLVIDGRRPGSAGATELETALILKELGAAEALCFDGGGSSALALRQTNGSIRLLNKPVHGGIPGRERAVAVCLGIVMRSVTY
jgi:hypothetical protein